MKQAPRELQEEYRQAKTEFSEHKLMLIDKETKKRMLEELGNDRVDIAEDEAKQAEADMQAKKATVTQLKRANQQRREVIRGQSAALAKGVAALRAREAELAEQMKRSVEENAAADELNAKAAQHAAAAGKAREQMRESEAALVAVQGECDALTQRLAFLHRQTAEEAQRTATLRADGDAMAAQLAGLREQSELAAGEAGEGSGGWYENVNRIVQSLSGIQKVSADGATLRYQLAGPASAPSSASCTLVVECDPESGAVRGARAEPEEALELADLAAHAVRHNALGFLLREAQARFLYDTHAAQPRAAAPPAAPRAGFAPGRCPARWWCPSAPTRAATRRRRRPSRRPPPPPPPPPPPASPPPRAARRVRSRCAHRSSSTRRFRRGAADARAGGGAPVENLNSRFAAAPPRRRRLEPRPPPMPTPAAAARTDEASAFARSERVARTPAASKPPASSAASASAAPSSDAAAAAAAAAPDGIKVEQLEERHLYSVGEARHASKSKDKARRQSRKSFARSVAHPVGAAERLTRAGIEMDPKAAISGLMGGEADGTQFSAVDASGHLRGTLTADGSVMGARGERLGYIEADGTVGAPNMDYLGEVTAPNENSMGFVTDEDDELIAQVDYGQSVIRDAAGSTIAAVNRIGEVTGHAGERCGILDGFSYDRLRAAAAYLTLIDKSFIHGK